jgi:hypothetical protein
MAKQRLQYFTFAPAVVKITDALNKSVREDSKKIIEETDIEVDQFILEMLHRIEEAIDRKRNYQKGFNNAH